MKIRKKYTFSNKKQIWRVLPSETGKLIIEERDPDAKEVFFSCIDMMTGEKIINKLMIKEKFWIGIERVYNDTIFFHKFRKPDMPGHLGIYAFNIDSKSIVWEKDNLIFLFIHNEGLFCYKEKFESRQYLKLNYKTGQQLEDFGNNSNEINLIREKVFSEEYYKGYQFSELYNRKPGKNEGVDGILAKLKDENLISGKIEYILLRGLIFCSFHRIVSSRSEMKKIFKVIDIDTGKVIFEEELERGVKNYIPDSFFIKDDLLFLIKNKSRLITCSISNN